MQLRMPFCFLLAVVALAQTPDARIQRIAEAGRLWGRVKWVHPALAEGKVDWDRALIEALPDLTAAETEPAQRAALAKLFAPLKDPALHIGPASEPAFIEVNSKQPLVEWMPGQVALLSLSGAPGAQSPNFPDALKEAKQALISAKGLIFDVRPSDGGMEAGLLESLLPLVATRTLPLPGARTLHRNGYPDQTSDGDSVYSVGWAALTTTVFMPAQEARIVPTTFIINRSSVIPASLLALQQAGLAYLVAEGEVNIGNVLPTLLEFGKVGKAQVGYSIAELLYQDGTTGFGVDRMVPGDSKSGATAQVVRIALDLIASKERPGSSVAWAHPGAMPLRKKDHAYPEMEYPNLLWRQLAVIRFWSVIDAFFPYKDLMDRPWDGVLEEYLARIESVKNAREYVLTLAEMATRLQDNHVKVTGPAMAKAVGEAGLPINFTLVQGKVVVSRLRDPKLSGSLNLWDEVLEVDGEPVEVAIHRQSKFIPAGNSWTQARNVFWYSLGRGEPGTSARLKIRDRERAERLVDIPRQNGAFKPADAMPVREGEVVRFLSESIGYADLARIKQNQLADLFEKNRGTKGLILDMRGYPDFLTMMHLTPYLNAKRAKTIAQYAPRIVQGISQDFGDISQSINMKFPKADGLSPYPGKVVFLMNEMTQSMAEQVGLICEAGCGATFVGSPTSGANGDATYLVLPGDIRVRFTGASVRHADGRQLQRVGLQPHILITPSLEGLRQGKDEVLDRAVTFLNTGN